MVTGLGGQFVLPRGRYGVTLRGYAGVCLRSSALTACLLATSPAFAGNVLPTGGSVAAGSATIVQTNPSTLTINQSTNQAIINWNTFSVGRGDTVNFNQPNSSSSTLNRVTSSAPSWIAGTINAPGTVLLINPNGIVITKSGLVNTGSFAASTLDIKDSDFLAGRYSFSGNGASAGVTNNGRITTSDGGFAALLGGQVSNNGVITARLGKVGLGAGEQATLDLSGDGFLSVAVPSSELGHLTTANGALVSNKGKINAAGGTVFLSAATASNILRNAVNMGGTIGANSVGTHNGRIVINGGGGTVNVTGRMYARNKKGKGGEIDITSIGATVRLAGAKIDASGSTGGGGVNIGGGPHATIAMDSAQSVSIDSATVIKANAIDNGDGGHIVVWSGGKTIALGTLNAKGGANGGNGGLIETSGETVNFGSITVDASAAKGMAGTWLIDPTNLTIDSAAGSSIANTLTNGTNVTLQTNGDGTTSGPGSTSSGAGDIIFASSFYTYSINDTLTVNAYNNIVINSGVSMNLSRLSATAGGSFIMNANTGLYDYQGGSTSIMAGGNIALNGQTILGGVALTAGGDITFAGVGHTLSNNPQLAAGGQILVNAPVTIYGGGSFNAGSSININASISNQNSGGSILLNSATAGGAADSVNFNNGATLTANGAAVTVYYHPSSYASPTSLSSVITGASSITSYLLVSNIAQLESISNNLGANYALNTDIDNQNAPFTTIGGTFSGNFDGQNHLIANLTNALFATNTGAIRNVGVSGSISGAAISNNVINNVGGLVDINRGTISNSFSLTSVNDSDGIGNTLGGLVGENYGIITTSYATGNVTTPYNYHVNGTGGLVGINYGTIQYSYASGNVSGGISAGGLVGFNGARDGDIGYNSLVQYSYALGSVSNATNAGGIVGYLDWQAVTGAHAGIYISSILNSYSNSPSVTGTYAGGIAGYVNYSTNRDFDGTYNDSSGKIWWTVWNANAIAQGFGFTYRNQWDIDASHGGGPNCANSPSCSTNDIQYIGFTSTQSQYTTIGAGYNGYQYLGSPYSQSSYATVQGGLFNDPTPGTGATQTSFSNNWYMVDGLTTPILRSEYSTNIQNAHQLQLINLSPFVSYTLARNIDATNDGLWSPNGFVPINAFYGYFNGNGNTISNLTQNLQGGYGGLFSSIQSGANVSNLGLVNPAIYVGNGYAVGALAGFNSGTVIGDWVSGGYVSSSGVQYVGGLIGQNNGRVTQSYTNTTVSGVAQNGAPNYNFYDIDGGLVGYNNGQVDNSYAVGKVYGNGTVGGLVGINDNTIYDTYSTGLIYNNYIGYGIMNAAGALVGVNNRYLSYSYWDSTLATYKQGPGTGLTTAQMQDINSFQSTYSGWDFQNIWAPPNQAGQGGLGTAYYPELYATSHIASVWASSASITYGSAIPVLTASVYGLKSYDPTSTIVISSISTTATSSSNAGTYAVNTTSNYPYISINGTTPAQTATVTGTTALTTQNGQEFFGQDSSLVINGVQVSGNCTCGAATVASRINAFTSQTGVIASVVGSGISAVVKLTGGSTITISSGDPRDWGFTNGSTAANTPNAPISRDGTAYRIVQVPGTLTINPVYLTGSVTIADIDKTYNGTAAAAGGSLLLTSASGVGITGNNQVTLSVSSGTYSLGANVAGTEAVSISSLSTSNPNYNVSGLTVTGSGAISAANITVTAVGGSSTYGSSPSNPGLSATGLQNGESVAVLTGLYNTFNITSATNAGNYTFGVGGSLTNANYHVTTTNSGSWTVNQATLTVTPNSGSSVYNNTALNNTTYSDNLANYSISGYVNGQNATSAGISLTGSMAFNGSTTTTVQNAGAYALAQGTLAVASNNSNYKIGFSNPTPNAYTITPATLTYVADTASMSYGGTVPTLTGTVNGFYGNDNTSNSTTGTLAFSTPASNLSNVGSYAINGSGLTVTNSNYTLAQASTNSTAFTVNKALLTVTGDKTYDVTTGFTTNQLAITGGVNGQTIALTSGSGTSSGADAGTYSNGSLSGLVFTVTGGTGNQLTSNYQLPTTAALTIDKANYTSITGNKTYDGSAAFAGVTLVGLNGQTFTVSSASSDNLNASSNPNGGATKFISASGIAGSNNAANPNNYSLNLTTIATNTATIAKANYTAITGSKTYDGSAAFSSGQVTLSGVNNETFNVAALSNSINASSNPSNPSTNFVNTSGPVTGVANADPNNYNALTVTSLTGSNNQATINTAALTITASNQQKTYGDTANLGTSAFTTSTLYGATDSVTGVTLSSAGANPLAGVNNSPYAITASAATGSGLANYNISYAKGALTVNPAQITVTANGGNSVAGQSPSNPGLSATGLKNGQDASVLTGLSNSFDITSQTHAGNYPLTVLGKLQNANYTVVATSDGLWIVYPSPSTPTSQFTPNSPNTPTNPTGIAFQNNNGFANITRASFTPRLPLTNTAEKPKDNNDVNTAELIAGGKFMHSVGRYFPPISQYDSDQYSDFKLPSYAISDSEATVLTILARGIAQQNAEKYMIDGFWNGNDNTWPGPGHIDLLAKAVFSDGAGHNVTPTNDPAFPIQNGKTDLAAMLKDGPVMIGGSAETQPVQWMLALGMAPDGKGILCDDTMTGGLVELSYDPSTKVVGGITKLFDTKSEKFVPLADASNDIPKSDAAGLSGLQGFVPSTYYAVSIH